MYSLGIIGDTTFPSLCVGHPVGYLLSQDKSFPSNSTCNVPSSFIHYSFAKTLRVLSQSLDFSTTKTAFRNKYIEHNIRHYAAAKPEVHGSKFRWDEIT